MGNTEPTGNPNKNWIVTTAMDYHPVREGSSSGFGHFM